MLNQLLEACPRASDVVAELAARLPSRALLVVVYSNAASLPGRILRRNWRRFFHWKAVYFNSENLRSMLERAGLRFVAAVGPEHVVHGDPRTRPRPSGHSGSRASHDALGLGAATAARADGDLRVDLRARGRVGGRASC